MCWTTSNSRMTVIQKIYIFYTHYEQQVYMYIKAIFYTKLFLRKRIDHVLYNALVSDCNTFYCRLQKFF